MLLGTIAFAVNGRKITATYGGITIYLNGQKQVATDVNGKTVEPLIYQGTTYVPIRAVSEWLGKTVTWQGSTSSVLINDSVFSDSDGILYGHVPRLAGHRYDRIPDLPADYGYVRL